MRSLLYALAVLSLPMRGAWIEILLAPWKIISALSLPMRGAWIEIVTGEKPGIKFDVAPHAGSVD